MNFFKLLLKLLFAALLIIVVFVASLATFIDPNNYKPEINNLIQKYTGRSFEINGTIQWSLAPQVALYLQDVTLGNAKGFEGTFLKAAEAHIKLDFIDLLKRQITINGIELQSPHLYLTKTKDNKTNFDDLIAISTKPKTTKPVNEKNIPIKIKEFTIKNANFTWTDNSTDKSINIKDFNLIMQNFSLSSNKTIEINPLKIEWAKNNVALNLYIKSFDKNPLVKGNLEIKKILPINILKTLEKTSVPKNMPKLIKGKWDLEYTSTSQKLKFYNIDLDVDQGKVNGELLINNPLLLLASTDFYNILQQLNANGKFNFTAIVIKDNLIIDQMQIPIIANHGLIKSNSILLEALDGKHQVNINLDVTKNVPSIEITNKSQNFPIEPIMASIEQSKKITGNADLNIDLKTQGDNLTALKQNLNGKIDFDINQGQLYGVDIHKLLKYAENTIQSLFGSIKNKAQVNIEKLVSSKTKDWQKGQGANAITNFDSLKANLIFHNGTSKNTKLVVDHSDYAITGTGEINIVEETIDLKILALCKSIDKTKSPNAATHMEKNPININVTGNLYNPSIIPDIASYIQKALQKLHKTIMKDLIKKQAESINDIGEKLKDSIPVLTDIFKKE